MVGITFNQHSPQSSDKIVPAMSDSSATTDKIHMITHSEQSSLIAATPKKQTQATPQKVRKFEMDEKDKGFTEEYKEYIRNSDSCLIPIMLDIAD